MAELESSQDERLRPITMNRQSIMMLGVGQCVNWGVLYYAFSILLLPMERELGISRWAITGAFTVALLASAAAAPMVGRSVDRGKGRRVMLIGGLVAAGLLVFWAIAPSGLPMVYLVWTGLGLCMAATLYEPAFAIVGREHSDPGARLRALAQVAVVGALASTIFLPFTNALITSFGWRTTVAVLGGVLAASTLAVDLTALRHISTSARSMRTRALPSSHVRVSDAGTTFPVVLVLFTIANIANTGLTTNLVPALEERSVDATTAAMLGAQLGLMQLPGRVLLTKGRMIRSSVTLVLLSLGLQAAAALLLFWAASVAIVAGALALFGAGAGFMTIARPHLVYTLFGSDTAGEMNGRINRFALIGRAAGPTIVASLATVNGYRPILLGLAGTFGLLALIALRTLVNLQGHRLKCEVSHG